MRNLNVKDFIDRVYEATSFFADLNEIYEQRNQIQDSFSKKHYPKYKEYEKFYIKVQINLIRDYLFPNYTIRNTDNLVKIVEVLKESNKEKFANFFLNVQYNEDEEFFTLINLFETNVKIAPGKYIIIEYFKRKDSSKNDVFNKVNTLSIYYSVNLYSSPIYNSIKEELKIYYKNYGYHSQSDFQRFNKYVITLSKLNILFYLFERLEHLDLHFFLPKINDVKNNVEELKQKIKTRNKKLADIKRKIEELGIDPYFFYSEEFLDVLRTNDIFDSRVGTFNKFESFLILYRDIFIKRDIIINNTLIKAISNSYYEIQTIIEEIIYANSVIDKLSGWDDIEFTILKLRCSNCTILVFKPLTYLFKEVVVGEKIKICAKEWKPNIFHFKKFC